MTPDEAPDDAHRGPDEENGGAEGDVEERLLYMKNTSELMIDLAYSALLYRSRDIAEEVQELEEYMDETFDSVVRDAVSAHKEAGVPLPSTLAILAIAQAAESFADSALEIADVLLRDVELHPVLSMAVEESDVTISRVHVQPESLLAGRTLGEVHVAKESGMRVIAVRRGSRTMYGPTKSTRIEKGDVLFARGPPDGEDKLRALVGMPPRDEDD